MIHSWQKLLDVILPPTPHTITLRSVTQDTISHSYQPRLINNIQVLGSYQHPWLKAAIAACKFEHSTQAATLLAHLCTTWLESHNQERILLLPIPLHPLRERERGYNQVTRVLECISLPHCTHKKDLLIRHRLTSPQTSLDKKARATNVANAFSVNQKIITNIDWQQYDHVVLCDDVLTTGATMNAARAALTPHLPRHLKLTCLAWAH